MRLGIRRCHATVRRIALATAVATASATAATASETGRAGAPFCFTLADLRTYVEAMRARDQVRIDALDLADACVSLKPGVTVQVTRTFADFGPGTAHPVGVRVFGNGASVDGFTLRETVIDPASR